MLVSRRYLPPTHLLSAFEAAARMGGFSLAARELNLTQSAISRQIKALETLLEVQLFVREKQKVHLTDAGKAYADKIRKAIQLIASASINLQTNPRGGSLNLAILPTFGTRWLAPRLPDFLANAPGITINLSTRMEPFEFSNETLDAAIHFGRSNWTGTETTYLMGETVLPACSPLFLEQHPILSANSLKDLPLLHLESRPQAWKSWFAEQNAHYDSNGGMMFDQFATATNAALSGLGVALLPKFLITQELKAGTLVPAINLPMKSEEAYYLVWPKERSRFPPLIAFQKWISNITGNERS
ncbi:MAG: LysR family transcriptional regulator [Sneathiella sp.]|nr:LysR family transcriptional regulator [Sneathiella sp.]